MPGYWADCAVFMQGMIRQSNIKLGRPGLEVGFLCILNRMGTRQGQLFLLRLNTGRISWQGRYKVCRVLSGQVILTSWVLYRGWICKMK